MLGLCFGSRNPGPQSFWVTGRIEIAVTDPLSVIPAYDEGSERHRGSGGLARDVSMATPNGAVCVSQFGYAAQRI